MPTAVEHVEAALERLTPEDIAALPPGRRQRLSAKLGAWARLCTEKRQPQPKTGVLADLKGRATE